MSEGFSALQTKNLKQNAQVKSGSRLMRTITQNPITTGNVPHAMMRVQGEKTQKFTREHLKRCAWAVLMSKHNLEDIRDEYYKEPNTEPAKCPKCGNDNLVIERCGILKFQFRCLKCGNTFL